jgi:hypothetical protein
MVIAGNPSRAATPESINAINRLPEKLSKMPSIGAAVRRGSDATNGHSLLRSAK